MSPSQRIGILTLIPKPKPPAELVYIKNWRPITLLNIDYKIFTHVIKNRILRSLPHIISNVQSGFQAGKSACDNLILMYLALEHFINNPEEEALLLQVDFEKAFDSVEHKFLFETLDFLGFGESLIRLVKVAFHGCMDYANINGHLSEPIYISRGLHQGSPLSPILFLLVAQIFTRKIENNPKIEGIQMICTRNPHWTESPLDGIPTGRNPHQISCSGDSVPWCPESPLNGIPTARLTSCLHLL